MRNTEIMLAVVNLAVLILACRGMLRQKRRSAAAFAVSAALLAVHLFVEGARWEMIPLYALTLLPAVLLLRGQTARQEKGRKRRAGIRIAAAAAVLLYGAAVVLPIALPVFKFEPLEGPYQVGTVTYAWTDESRP